MRVPGGPLPEPPGGWALPNGTGPGFLAVSLAMIEDAQLRDGKAATLEKQDANSFRYLGELNPLKHMLPDVVQAELSAANKRRAEEGL